MKIPVFVVLMLGPAPAVLAQPPAAVALAPSPAGGSQADRPDAADALREAALNTLQSDSDHQAKARLEVIRDRLRGGDITGAAEQCPQVEGYRQGMAWGEVAICAAVAGEQSLATNALAAAERTWPLHGEWRASRIAARVARACLIMNLSTNAVLWASRVTESEDLGLATQRGGPTDGWATALGEAVRGAQAPGPDARREHYRRMASAAAACDARDDGEMSLAAARLLLDAQDPGEARSVARRVELRIRALSPLADWKMARLCALSVIYSGCGEGAQARTLHELAGPLASEVDPWRRPGALAWLAVAQTAAGDAAAGTTWERALAEARAQAHPRARAQAVLDALAAAEFGRQSLPDATRSAWEALARDSTVSAR